MYGKNKILKPDLGDGQSLFIKEIFPTIQGEGPLAGSRAVFIRVGGCNLKCFACDTDFDINPTDERTSLQEIMQIVYGSSLNTLPPWAQLVVITGGEPFRQNIVPLIATLLRDGYRVQIETAGTLWLPDLSHFYQEMNSSVPKLMIICSPKTGTLNRDVTDHVYAYKYVIRKGECSEDDGLPNYSTQIKGKLQSIARPPKGTPVARIYVQPWDDKDEEKNAENTVECINLSLTYGYRISLQLHKFLGVA